MRRMLDGKKTYLAAMVMIVLAGLKATGYINDQTYQQLMAVVGGLGLMALRQAVDK